MSEAASNVQESKEAVKKRKRKAFWDANKDRINALNRARRAANPERDRANKLAWNKANREKNNARMKAWRAANFEKARAIDRERYAKNPQIKKAYSSSYYAANKEQIAARRKIYGKARHKAHPEISRSYNAKRRALELGATVGNPTAITAWEKKWKRLKFVTCYWCRKPHPPKRCHADHVVPLSKGGTHSLDNLCISCAPCNLSKSAKLPDAWGRQLTEPVLL